MSGQTYCVQSCGDDFTFSKSGDSTIWCTVNCTYSSSSQVQNYVVGSSPSHLTKICVPRCSVIGNITINATARYCNMCTGDKKVSYGQCISLSKACPSEVPYVQTIGELKVCSQECQTAYW